MNRVTRGLVVLAAALVALSCAGDPTSDLRNGADHLVANPSALFVNSGSLDTPVLISVVDEQGNPLESSFKLDGADVGLTVEEDTAYNHVYNNKGVLVQPSKWTRARYLIDATAAAGDLGFQVSAGGKSIRVPVRVLPLNLPVTFSNANPGFNEQVTMTVAPGFLLQQTATLAHAGGGPSPIIVSRAADGSSITFIAYPGANAGTLDVSGVELDFLPGTPFDLSTDLSITPQAAAAGTDAFATAPTVTMPGVGQSAVIVDAGSFAGSSDCQNVNPGGWDCRIYTFTIGSAVTLTFSNTWDSTTDLGLYFDDLAHTDPFSHGCDGKGAGAAGQPETCSITFAPGTYTMQMTTYSAFYAAPNNVDPGYFRIDVTGS